MKIIALMPIKNEAWILKTTIPQMQLFADEILALYTPSTDKTAEILKSFGVQVKEQPYYPVDYSLWRQMLLDWGRQRGGTHFIWLDADEAFTSNMLGEFRDHMAGLKPGQKLTLHWLCLWKDARKYRKDNSVWSGLCKDFVFCDDGISGFRGGATMHEGRTPGQSTFENCVKLPSEKGAVLHFQFVPFERFQMKQAFVKSREFLEGKFTPGEINAKYSFTLDDGKAACVDIPEEWLEGIKGLDGLNAIGPGSYYDDIKKLFHDKGILYFEPMQIWHIPQLREEFIKAIGREPKPILRVPFLRRAKGKMHRELGKISNIVNNHKKREKQRG